MEPGEVRILVVPVDGPLQEVLLEPEDHLTQLQVLVGGSIELVAMPYFIEDAERATAYINEEGKNLGLPFNGRATDFFVPGEGLFMGDYIAGPLLLLGVNGSGDAVSVPAGVEHRIRLIDSEAGA